MRLLVVIFFITGSFFISCTYFQKQSEEQVARVGDKYLYRSDITGIAPADLSKEDSITIVHTYINKWIKSQLLLQKAELNLSEEQKNVTKQLSDYRQSLLIFKYKQELIKQKLDTLVSDKEIKKYYEENGQNFLLKHSIVKAVYLKVPRNSPYLYKVRKWYKSDDEQDLKELENYCYQYAAKYDYFDDQWIRFKIIKDELPQKIDNEDWYLRSRKYVEVRDTSYQYFVYLKDYLLKGNISPIILVKEDIKSIILNKRKLQFFQDLENSIYNDALNKNKFEIYN